MSDSDIELSDGNGSIYMNSGGGIAFDGDYGCDHASFTAQESVDFCNKVIEYNLKKYVRADVSEMLSKIEWLEKRLSDATQSYLDLQRIAIKEIGAYKMEGLNGDD